MPWKMEKARESQSHRANAAMRKAVAVKAIPVDTRRDALLACRRPIVDHTTAEASGAWLTRDASMMSRAGQMRLCG